MYEPAQQIDWIRWLVYLIGGIPLFVWIFTVRDRTLRLFSVLVVAFFVQDLLAGRRYFWAFSLSPAIASAYVALLACVVAKRKLPQLGVYGPMWLGLLFAAFVGVVSGSGGGLLAVNVKYFQLSYLDGLVFFLFGLMALETSEEHKRFWEWFVLFALAMALAHLLSVATGFRFRGAYKEGISYGAVLDNANTLGSFYTIAIPPILSLAVRRRLSRVMQLFAYASLGAMAGSLLLTGCRSAMLFTFLLGGYTLLRSGVPAARVVSAGVLSVVVAGIGALVMSVVAAETWQAVFRDLEEQGTRTDRWGTFWGFLRLVIDHPFGIGLSPENARPLAPAYQLRVLSSHNIYLDMAVQIGIVGTGIFLWLCVHVLASGRRALRLTRDALEWDALFCSYLALLGFLAIGIFQPIYTATVSAKMNNLFWLLAGVNANAVARVLAAHRARVERESDERDRIPLPARPSRA